MTTAKSHAKPGFVLPAAAPVCVEGSLAYPYSITSMDLGNQRTWNKRTWNKAPGAAV